MDTSEVVGDMWTGKDVISVLAICEIVIGQVRARENQVVINAVQFHMLKSPAFIDTPRYDRFADPS